MNDQDAWSDFIDGSEPAFTFLYKKYAPLLFRYGMKINNDRDLVKDGIQILYLNLWNSRKKLSKPDSVKNYLCKGLRIEIFKRLGEQEKVRILKSSLITEATHSHEAEIIQLTTETHQQESITKALALLPDRQREIIFLRYYSNLSYSQIAGVMDIETESVYKLTYKALNKLQHILNLSLTACYCIFSIV